MNEEEFSQLLEYTRSLMAEIGRPDIDEAAVLPIHPEDLPSEATVRYFEAILTQFTLESREGVARATASLNAALLESGADRIRDIVLINDQMQLQGRRAAPIPLGAALPSRERLLHELRSMMAELQSERPFSADSE